MRMGLSGWTRRAAPLAALLCLLLVAPGVTAHPHLFVGVETTVLYDSGHIAGLRHKWSFDEAFSADAVEGLDTNHDGTYSREELAELTKVNIESIKDALYYTVAKVGQQVLKFGTPTDSYLEMKDGILTLNFTLPFAEPVMADAEGFTFSVYDESFYIAFDYADASAVKLGEGAPPACKAALAEPPGEDASSSAQLSDAFANALGSWGAAMAKSVTVSCAKS